jgi:hypothetical protein
MLKLEEKLIKKTESNPSNLLPRSWDRDNPIKIKSNVEGHMTQVMRPR